MRRPMRECAPPFDKRTRTELRHGVRRRRDASAEATSTPGWRRGLQVLRRTGSIDVQSRLVILGDFSHPVMKQRAPGADLQPRRHRAGVRPSATALD